MNYKDLFPNLDLKPIVKKKKKAGKKSSYSYLLEQNTKISNFYLNGVDISDKVVSSNVTVTPNPYFVAERVIALELSTSDPTLIENVTKHFNDKVFVSFAILSDTNTPNYYIKTIEHKISEIGHTLLVELISTAP